MLLDDEANRLLAAWQHATPTDDPSIRIDCDGRYIAWQEYGQLTRFGWEVDHIKPKGFGGLDRRRNLRARHWKGNRSAGASTENALRSFTY